MRFESKSQSSQGRSRGAENRWRRLWSWLREFNATQVELHERFLLLNRPWEEDYLHWAHDGTQWQLHGQWPSPGHSRRGVTRGGWCVGRRGEYDALRRLPR